MSLEATTASAPLARRLVELVRVRVSQLNGCAFCIDMHVRAARAAGETNDRLLALAGWPESPWFSERERAALAVADALTRDPSAGLSDELWTSAQQALGDTGLAALLVVTSVINAWNRIAIATQLRPPAPDDPDGVRGT